MLDIQYNTERPLIVLCNDDGIAAPGLQAMAKVLAELGDVVVFAPSFPRSGASHAITLSEPLRLVEQDFPYARMAMATNGTPVDAVKLGLHVLKPKKPDLLVSGINLGANTGIFVVYSGTVAAAREGCINGIPSLAISLTTFTNPRFETAAVCGGKVSQIILDKKWDNPPLINMNVPNIPQEEILGIRIARQGYSVLVDHYDERTDPRDGKYFWLVDNGIHQDKDEGSDEKAILDGYCSLTPLHWDHTDHTALAQLDDAMQTFQPDTE